MAVVRVAASDISVACLKLSDTIAIAHDIAQLSLADCTDGAIK